MDIDAGRGHYWDQQQRQGRSQAMVRRWASSSNIKSKSKKQKQKLETYKKKKKKEPDAVFEMSKMTWISVAHVGALCVVLIHYWCAIDSAGRPNGPIARVSLSMKTPTVSVLQLLWRTIINSTFNGGHKDKFRPLKAVGSIP